MSGEGRGVVVNAGGGYENPTAEFFKKWLGIGEFFTLDSYRLAVSEFFGTFYLCFMLFACLSGLEVNKIWAQGGAATVLLCGGSMVVCVIWITFHLSVSNLNPALSIAFAVNGVIPLARAAIYIPAQLIGAICAPALLTMLIPSKNGTTVGSSHWPTRKHPDVTVNQAIGWEFLGTALLAILYLACVDVRHRHPHEGLSGQFGQGPLHAGLTVVGILLGIAPFSGGSINPARSFGPALVLGVWDNHYVYWVGPILGAVCGAAFYKMILHMPWKAKSCRDVHPKGYASTVSSGQVPLENTCFWQWFFWRHKMIEEEDDE
jgi:MIP family channel proteins